MNQEAIIELFCRVLECDRCSHSIVLRDSFENIPQPGYIGRNYEKYRILLIGQNPGVCPPSMKNKDFVYMEALKNLWINKDKSSMINYIKFYFNLFLNGQFKRIISHYMNVALVWKILVIVT